MRPLYVTSAVAAALYWTVIIVWVVSESSVFFRGVTIARDRRQDRFSGPALVGGLLLAIWIGGMVARLVPSAAIAAGRPLVFVLGVVLALAGIVLRQVAIATLGRFFTVRVMTQPGQTVVDSGPYRFVRHPSYSGMLLTVFGVLLCSTNWLALACFAAVLPGLAYRIKVEEGALINALGDPYLAYMRRVPRLVPMLV